MASITSYASYLTKLNNPYTRIQDTKNSVTTVAGHMFSSWIVAPQAGLIPSTSATCDASTIGALGQTNSNFTQSLAQVGANMAQFGTVMLVDRLVHQGGLSGIVSISAQLTNLPTPLPTRYTGSYVGTMAAIELYVAVGGTGAIVSGSYINQNGSTSSFQPTNIGTATYNTLSRFIILPLHPGDTGVQQVLSIVLSTSTATAGNMGITIFRPIAMWAIPFVGGQQLIFDSITSNAMQFEQIQNNACLQYIFTSGTTSTGIYQSFYRLIET